jgi:hypothetical protein
MTPARALAELGMDLNNLTNQLAIILHESFDIEHKGHGESCLEGGGGEKAMELKNT